MRPASMVKIVAAALFLTAGTASQAEAGPYSYLDPCTGYCIAQTTMHCLPDHPENPEVCLAFYGGCEFSCRAY